MTNLYPAKLASQCCWEWGPYRLWHTCKNGFWQRHIWTLTNCWHNVWWIQLFLHFLGKQHFFIWTNTNKYKYRLQTEPESNSQCCNYRLYQSQTVSNRCSNNGGSKTENIELDNTFKLPATGMPLLCLSQGLSVSSSVSSLLFQSCHVKFRSCPSDANQAENNLAMPHTTCTISNH